MTLFSLLLLTVSSPSSFAAGASACAYHLADDLSAVIFDHVRANVGGVGRSAQLEVIGVRRSGRAIECVIGIVEGESARHEYILARDDGSVVTTVFRPELRAQAIQAARNDRVRLNRRGRIDPATDGALAVMTDRGWRVTLAIVDRGETADKPETFDEVYDVDFRPNLDLNAKSKHFVFPPGHPAATPSMIVPDSFVRRWWQRVRRR